MLEDINLKTLHSFFKLIKELNLSEKEINEILGFIRQNYDANCGLDSLIESYRANTSFTCPYCDSSHFKKNGNDLIKNNGTTVKRIQRYYCKDCKKTFNLRTGTIAAHSKISYPKLQAIVHFLKLNLSAPVISKEIGLSVNTIQLWKHKLADGNRNADKDIKLDYVIETDETFMRESFKGNHSKDGFTMPRFSRHRASSYLQKHKRGLSKDTQVCICCAVDSSNKVIAHPTNMGASSASDFHMLLDGRFGYNPMLVTDGSASYKKFAKESSLPIIQITGGKKSVSNYNIQRINSYHANFKAFNVPHKGYSTKYLPNYLTIYSDLVYKKGNPKEVEENFLRTALTMNVITVRKTMKTRNPLPILNLNSTVWWIKKCIPNWIQSGFMI